MSIRIVSDKVYNKLTFNIGKFPTWLEAKKLIKRDKTKCCNE